MIHLLVHYFLAYAIVGTPCKVVPEAVRHASNVTVMINYAA